MDSGNNIDSTDTGPCAVCSNESSKHCVKCMQVYYCSREHQVEDWKKHKIQCHPVKIITIQGCNRKALVAVRDIPQGEIIMKEKALITGPRADTGRPDRFPLCLECYRVVQGNYCCTKCLWPLCNPACQKGKYHSNFECPIFTTNRVNPATNWQEYLGVNILRVLMLKEKNPEKWAKVLELESKADQFGSFEITFGPILDFIRSECGQIQYNLDTIQFVAGALQVNRMSDENDNEGIDQPFGSYLYHKTNFASHSCVPNAMWFIQSSSDLYLRASVSIRKDQLVTNTIVPMEGGTLDRRTRLEIYGINCNCKRCTDPTELGTYMSGVTCTNCNDPNTGYYLAQNPTLNHTDWKCINTNCGSIKSGNEIQEIVSRVQNMFKTIESNFQNRNELNSHLSRIKEEEKLLKKYEGKVLHKNHSILFVVKKDLSSRIPQIAPHIKNDNERMEVEAKQVGWAKESLELADKFWPGYSRYRGQLLYNLQRGMFCLIFSEVEHLAKSRRSRAYNTERVTKLREAFEELLNLRVQVKIILEIEADSKVEKQLALEMDHEGQDFDTVRRLLQI